MTVTEIKNIINQKVDPVSLIGKFVKLKKKGADYFALCPFHNEKTASFSVSPSKRIFKCFGCGQSGDAITFIMLHERLSYIDALKKIGELESLPISFEHSKPFDQSPQRSSEDIKFVPKEILVKTLSHYDQNPFFGFVENLVGKERALHLFAEQFYVGTAKGNGTIFWQVDQFMRIRTGQKIFYQGDGHRIKAIPPKRLYTTERGYKPCFFGEHQLLLCDHETLVGIVESEKTAIICSIYLPKLSDKKIVWLASGGMNGLTDEKIWALKGMEVVLCPDFSFISRATWGLVPMRKKEEDGKMKPHPDGEIDKEYVSYAMKLKKLGCKVSCYDPLPDINDNSDIADQLSIWEPPKVEAPDYSQLLLEEGF